MRNLRLLDAYRDTSPETLAYYGSAGDHGCGVFKVPSVIDGAVMMIVASDGEGWDHVSVSRRNRCPNWPEMSQIKHMFFSDEETVVQYHVPVEDHRNLHQHCLHLWRPQDVEIPRPPGILVAPDDTITDRERRKGGSPVTRL